MFSKGKVTRFFSEKYIYPQLPLFGVFLEEPNNCEEEAVSLARKICKLGNVTCFGEFYNVKITQNFVA